MATLPVELSDDANLPAPYGGRNLARVNILSGDFLSGVGSLPIVRQFGLLIGLAASIALGFWAVLWLREPDYQPVTGGWASYDQHQVIELMQAQGITYKVNDATGTILVPVDQATKAKVALAAADLLGEHAPTVAGADDAQPFGASQFTENNRHMHALEVDLAHTIETMSSVKTARVHIAEPRTTSFIRDQRKASASVMLQVRPGKRVDRGQVRAIMNLVAFAVPDLPAAAVSVVDQQGSLLSGQEEDSGAEAADREFQYSRRVEDDLLRKIADILSPTVGAGRFRAQVAADVDFTARSETGERYENEQPTLVSDQSRTEKQTGDAPETGVPGALSNTPPAAASVPQTTAATPPAAGAAAAPNTATAGAPGAVPGTRSRQEETHNYNPPGRTISAITHQQGIVKRLTVSVVVDDVPANDAKTGAVSYQAWTPAELERLQVLIKSAVGYDAARGDVVAVVNAPFVEIPDAPVVIPGFWTEPWFLNIVRDGFIALVVLGLGLGVLRPAFRALSKAGVDADAAALASVGSGSFVNDNQLDEALDDIVSLTPGARSMLASSAGYGAQLDAVRGIIAEDPARVAAVIKSWIAVDE